MQLEVQFPQMLTWFYVYIIKKILSNVKFFIYVVLFKKYIYVQTNQS